MNEVHFILHTMSYEEHVNGRKSRPRRFDPSECTKKRQAFTAEEDNMILALVEELGLGSWDAIAKNIKGRSLKQVKDRYMRELNPNIKKMPWTKSEDALLLEKYLEIGPHWLALGRTLNRSDYDVKNRFHTYISKMLDIGETITAENECTCESSLDDRDMEEDIFSSLSICDNEIEPSDGENDFSTLLDSLVLE